MEFREGQTVIFDFDPYNEGFIGEYDGYITGIYGDKIYVNYLYGYRDMHDTIKADMIVALVDENQNCPYYKTKEFSGHLIPNPLYRGK